MTITFKNGEHIVKCGEYEVRSLSRRAALELMFGHLLWDLSQH